MTVRPTIRACRKKLTWSSWWTFSTISTIATRYFKSCRDSLKPGGRIAIIDFRMDSPDGPPKSARIAPDRVKAELKSAGYALVQEHAFLPNQYFLVFQPTKL